jgi:membrane protease YdiL (CAAX protease family)
MFLALPFFEGSPTEFLEYLMSPVGHPEIKIPLFIVQGAATLIGLALVPAYYLYRSQGIKVQKLFSSASLTNVALVIAIVIFFMGFNSIFIGWNAGVTLPDFLAEFEAWAREKEDIATRITQFLTSFDSTAQFMVAFIVIAVLPAFGEELVFRGMVQRELHKGTGNIHVAIWIAACLFSALHLQFFGFVPRVLLGALFGYLYHWSGNLLIPVIAHFVNNGFSLLMIYFHKTEIAGVDLESPKAAPWPIVLTFSFLTFTLLYYFRKTQKEQTPQA